MDPKEQAFRDAAKAEGYSEQEILSHLAGLNKKSSEPTLPVSNTYEDFTKKEMPEARTAVQRMKESSSDTGSIVPYAIGAGGTAAVIAAGATAKKVYDTLSKKMEASIPTDTSKQTSFIQQEPTFDWQNFKPTDVTGTVPEQPVTQTGLTAKPTIADLQQKLGIAPNVVAPVAPVAPVASVAPVAPTPSAVEAVTPPVDAAITADPTATPVEKAQAHVNAPEVAPETPAAVNRYDVTTPVDGVTPVAETAPATTVTDKQNKKIKGAVAPTGPIQTVKTGSGLDAYLGQGAAKERIPSAFKTAAEIPAGYAFVPGADVGGMNTARNRLGQEGYTEFVKAQGTPFGTYDETQKVLQSLDENRIGPTLTREQRKTIGAPMLPNTTGLGGKAIKVGGVAGALLAISDLASAQSLPEAGSKALEIGSGLLPVPLQGAIFSGGTNVGEQAQIDYLRRMQEAKARGAGNRGMAYDPRIPYNPQFMNVGIPPPFNR